MKIDRFSSVEMMISRAEVDEVRMSVAGQQDAWVVITAATRQWWNLAMEAVQWYADVLDPRPDLSVPARKLTTPFIWWW